MDHEQEMKDLRKLDSDSVGRTHQEPSECVPVKSIFGNFVDMLLADDIESVEKLISQDPSFLANHASSFSYEFLERLYSKIKKIVIYDAYNRIGLIHKLSEMMKDDEFVFRSSSTDYDDEEEEETDRESLLGMKGRYAAKAGKIINWLTNNQFPNLYGNKNDELCLRRDLFLWALLHCKFKLAELLWKSSDRDYVAAALTASYLLKSMAKQNQGHCLLTQGSLRIKIRVASEAFEMKAKKVFQECCEDDFNYSIVFLLRAFPEWGGKTLCYLACSGRHVEFLSLECCQYALNVAWSMPIRSIENNMSNWFSSQSKHSTGFRSNSTKQGNSRVNESHPLEIDTRICANGEDFDDGKALAKLNESAHEKIPTSSVKRVERGHSCGCLICVVICLSVVLLPITLILCAVYFIGYKVAWKVFKNRYAPLYKFAFHTLSYLVFLVLFSIFIMTDLRPNHPSICEYLVWIWAATMWLDEFRQLCDTDASTFWLKICKYFSSFWNRYDQIAFSLFLCAIVVRITVPTGSFHWATMVYAVSLIVFIIRLLQHLAVVEYFGPKVGILYNMMFDTLSFLFIFALFLFAYGISAQALLYPNSTLSWKILFNIVYSPYFALFGENDLQTQFLECSHNDTILSANPEIPKCSWLANLLLVLYAMMVSVVLVNLLIATYSATYNRAEENAMNTWLSFRVDLINEFLNKPVLVPPFIVISHALKLLALGYHKCARTDSQHFGVDLKLKFSDEQIILLDARERSMMNKLFKDVCRVEEDVASGAQIRDLISTNEKLAADLQDLREKIDKILLYVVENQTQK